MEPRHFGKYGYWTIGDGWRPFHVLYPCIMIIGFSCTLVSVLLCPVLAFLCILLALHLTWSTGSPNLCVLLKPHTCSPPSLNSSLAGTQLRLDTQSLPIGPTATAQDGGVTTINGTVPRITTDKLEYSVLAPAQSREHKHIP